MTMTFSFENRDTVNIYSLNMEEEGGRIGIIATLNSVLKVFSKLNFNVDLHIQVHTTGHRE